MTDQHPDVALVAPPSTVKHVDVAPTTFEYASAPESTAVVNIADRYELFIDGEFVEPRSGKHFATINPATEARLASVAEAGAADIDAAVRAARRAYDNVWGAMPGRQRAKYLYRIARVLQERAREFAVLESLDGGKPIRESRDVDVPLAAAHFFYHAGWADKLDYAFPGRTMRPLGVAAQVIPWNFPLLMAAWKIAPALATGNTVVLKPAETTPLSSCSPTCCSRSICHPASSTSSRARERPARRWSRTRASTRSRSPVRPRSAS
jgi:aldehyde dehydrogenase (NAD+)